MNTPGSAKTLLTEAELEAITTEELAKDPEKLKLYSDNRAAAAGRLLTHPHPRHGETVAPR